MNVHDLIPIPLLISTVTILAASLISFIVYRFYNLTYPHGSIYRTLVRPYISLILTSSQYQRLRWNQSRMKQTTKRIVMHAFLSIDDPQSFILMQCLQILQDKYPIIDISLHVLHIGIQGWDTSIVDPKPWILHDSQLFAQIYDLCPPYKRNDEDDKKTTTSYMISTTYQLLKASRNRSIGEVTSILASYWTKDVHTLNMSDNSNSADEETQYQNELQVNTQLLRDLGYYGPGVIEVEGEFYAPNRLHHLERRLLEYQAIDQVVSSSSSSTSGAKHEISMVSRIRIAWMLMQNSFRPPMVDIFDPRLHFTRQLMHHQHLHLYKSISSSSSSTTATTQSPTVDLFYSFRSPYSQLAIIQLSHIMKELAITIRMRVMLPMVLRGLAVPLSKVKFIALDCAREARLIGATFGSCCDPIEPEGKPIYRALDAYIIAKKYDKEVDYIVSFATHVWGMGVDAGTDHGMRCIIEAAGLPWHEVKLAFNEPAVASEWTAITTANRDYLYNKGFWGVPCIQYEDEIVWGQDKIYHILENIKQKQQQQQQK